MCSSSTSNISYAGSTLIVAECPELVDPCACVSFRLPRSPSPFVGLRQFRIECVRACACVCECVNARPYNPSGADTASDIHYLLSGRRAHTHSNNKHNLINPRPLSRPSAERSGRCCCGRRRRYCCRCWFAAMVWMCEATTPPECVFAYDKYSRDT